jgi:hypothetical protein
LINSALLVRQLGPADRDAYFQLRLRGLKAHPESFGQSYEEAVAKGAARHDAKATFCSELTHPTTPR